MELTVDKFGRVLLPKRLRDLLGLGPGSKVSVTASPNELLLRPVESAPVLAEENGVLVFQGELDDADTDFVRRIREERLDRFGAE
ncbi:MAG: AbrB/MazE/SpoVT family DNA-binding domain-containing protein [Planctomycetota bacterium]